MQALQVAALPSPSYGLLVVLAWVGCPQAATWAVLADQCRALHGLGISLYPCGALQAGCFQLPTRQLAGL